MSQYAVDATGNWNPNQPPPVSQVSSRIDNQVERVRMLTEQINSTTNRIMKHAHSLGFFNAEKTPSPQSGVSAIPTNLNDALTALNEAVERQSGALNVFD